ncbi:MAG: hypothetical protein V4463_12575 [Pseudomonadota bacterium]
MHTTRINFVTRAAPLTGWRFALLVVGVLALGATSLFAIVQLRIAARLETDLAQAQPRRAERPTLSVTQQRDQEQQIKSINDAVRQLNLPVTRLIKTVQAPRDIRVALLGMDLAAGTLKISAEGETARDMINYVAYLGEQSLFTSVYLVKHEANLASPDHPYRFQLEAQWRD